MTVILPKTPANHYGKICGEVNAFVLYINNYTCMYCWRVTFHTGKGRCKKKERK